MAGDVAIVDLTPTTLDLFGPQPPLFDSKEWDVVATLLSVAPDGLDCFWNGHTSAFSVAW